MSSTSARHRTIGTTRVVTGCVALALGCLLAAFATLSFGTTWSTPHTVLDGLLGRGDTSFVITQWRLPRALAALVFGAALGLSGAVFQNLTRNPLGSPDIIGLESAAFTGALVVLAFLTAAPATVATGAVSAGLIAATVIYLLSRKQGFSGLRLIVIGIAVNAMVTAANQWLVLRTDLDVAIAATSWSVGSLNGIDWADVHLPFALVTVLALTLAMQSRTMHQAALGDDLATTTGVRLTMHRVALVALGVGCTAVVIGAVGPITFVALAAPQIGRRITASAGVPLLPAALTGAFVLACSDLVAQLLARPTQLPVGVVTTGVGGAYLIWLLVSEARKR